MPDTGSAASGLDRVAVIGSGRAGGSFANALARVGWRVDVFRGRSDNWKRATSDHDFVLIAVPDGQIGKVAERLASGPGVVAHLSGATTLEHLRHHGRHGSIHPLMSLPDPQVGAERLVGAHYAVAGDEALLKLVNALGGVAFSVAESDRTRYHAAAVTVSNHLIGLIGAALELAEPDGSSEALAAALPEGVPLEGLVQLAAATLDNVRRLGLRPALTGPLVRGDHKTIRAHLAALSAEQRTLYLALARATYGIAHPGEPIADWLTEASD